MAEEPQGIKVNPLVGKSFGLGMLPAEQIPLWILSFGLGGLVWSFYDFSFDSVSTILFWSFLPCVVLWILTGNKPYRFFEKFYRPRRWLRGNPHCQWIENLPHKPYLGKRRVATFNSPMKVDFDALEDSFPLVCYGEARLQGQCGFTLSCDGQRRRYRIAWAWQTDGIDSNLTEKEAKQRSELADKALKELPPGVTLIQEMASFASDDDYQAILDEQLVHSSNQLGELLIYSEKTRTRELRNEGKRQIQKIRLFAIYEIDFEEGSGGHQDWLSRWGKGLTAFLESFKGDKLKKDQKRFQAMLLKAYNEGFRRIDSLLNTIMALEAVPIPGQNLFETDYREHHNSAAPPLPQLLVLDHQGLRTEAEDPFIHVTSYLTRPERGESAVLKTAPSWVYYPIKRQYVGFMQLYKPESFPKAEQENPYRGQMRYLQELSARGVYDFKIITEFSLANQGMQKWDLERHTRNANETSERAFKDKTVDVAAQFRSNDAIEARESIHQGGKIFSYATGIFLYRNNPAALNYDFARVADCFQSAPTERAWEVTDRFCLQMFPFSWERLLTRPYDRRDFMFSHELPGMMPLLKSRSGDKSGIPFLSSEGGTPIWIDPIHELMNLLILATTRAGKSVLLAQIIFSFFLYRIPTVVFDFPRPTDGTSTFSDLVNLIRRLGGSAFYFDIGSCSNNLLQMSDVRGLDRAEERRQAMLDFHVDAIVLISMGDVDDALLEGEVRSLVEQSYRDFQGQKDIQARYLASFKAKLGTEEYQNVPTLWNYLAFVEPWLKDYLDRQKLVMSERVREAAAQILSQLRSCLHGKLGRAIAQPSSFPEDPDLFVIALRNTTSNREVAIMTMAGYSTLLKKALEKPACAFILDEGPILFEFPSIAKRVAHQCSNGLKWGCRVIISAQTAKNIFKSGYGDQITQTIDTKMAGFITDEGVNSLEDHLGFDRHRTEKYATDPYRPSKKGLFSNWLIKRGNTYLEARFYPSEILLALVANNPDEQAARNRVMAAFDDPLTGLAHFGKLYAHALRNGIPMDKIMPARSYQEVSINGKTQTTAST